MDCVCTHLVCEIEVWVHLDHLPAAVTILIDSYEEAGVVLLPPINVKVCCLRVAWNHIPIEIHTVSHHTTHLVLAYLSQANTNKL